jgi:hypothetical protein
MLMAVFTDVRFNPNVTVQALSDIVDLLMLNAPQAIMILCTDEASSWGDEYDKWVKNIEVPVFGGVFPGLIVDAQFKPNGLLVLGLTNTVTISVIENISSTPPQLSNINLTSPSTNSIMIMVDALSRQIDNYLRYILQVRSTDCSIFGGGTGSLTFTPQPCLFSSTGMHKDAMLLIEMPSEWDLAVGHGWDILAGPYLANKTDDSSVLELNFEPATDLYYRVVEEHSQLCFSKHDFFNLASTFPLGLARLDDSVLIRAPLKEEDKKLICAGDIPENTMLYIMHGIPEKLISTVSEAVKEQISAMPSTQTVSDCILFDCISRQLFLGEEFATELTHIHQALPKPTQLFGALVLGEIALAKNGILSLYNKTAVTALARDKNKEALK